MNSLVTGRQDGFALAATPIDQQTPRITTSNVTGRNAVEGFSRAVVWQRLQKGTAAKPIIELGSVNVLTQYGSVAVPKIEIVDWWDPTEADVPVVEPGRPPPRTPPSRAPRPQPAPAAPITDSLDLDDEIPC